FWRIYKVQISVIEWIENTGKNFPDKVAIVDENSSITYGEYRRKSRKIASSLIELGLGKQNPVIIYLRKSLEVLVAFMGVAYSRNFYCPIDVEMPEARVNKIIDTLNPAIVITTRELADEFKKFHYSGSYLFIEEIEGNCNENAVNARLQSIIDTDLLYVLFTSGSTGVPKGVGIRHRSVIDYIDWVTSEFEITCEDSFGNQAPFYFDNSILDIYSCLKTGATLYIIPHGLFMQASLLLKYLKRNGVSTIFWVPSALIAVARLKALKNIDLNDVLKRVLFCGEVMPNKQLNYWRKNLTSAVYANLYGPTEITDACTYYVVDRDFSDDEPLPIGKPMRNTEILVLDEDNRLVDESDCISVGELCVKGTSLAVGYYNNPEKTKDAFVQNPLNTAYEEKIYRTGDIVAYNKYKELMYMGRKDYQIKHMGHRIELGEIETAASSFDYVLRCCAQYDDNKKKIVLIIETNEDIDSKTIEDDLRRLIPEYMIPGKIVSIEKLPLNSNGKIDRKLLKEMVIK
ncbi:MAG: amino acid adenylation domain-containing protein, partial [Ruminococcus flavefaciens]|nr:amino acid adenylation domain-containing protein [Ruminococcus flavefaciens]